MENKHVQQLECSMKDIELRQFRGVISNSAAILRVWIVFLRTFLHESLRKGSVFCLEQGHRL